MCCTYLVVKDVLQIETRRKVTAPKLDSHPGALRGVRVVCEEELA